MTVEEIISLLKDVRFGQWQFNVASGHGGIYLQAAFPAVDACLTGEPSIHQYSRKWLLSPHMTKSEIVQTAFKCVLTAMEHEAREFFTFKGFPIFGPHFDVDALVEICQMGRFEKR